MAVITSKFEDSTDKVWYQSSNIVYSECVDIADQPKQLKVVFKDGRTYCYKDVDVNDYIMFKHGSIHGSQGKAFNEFIVRKKYICERIEDNNLNFIKEDGEKTLKTHSTIDTNNMSITVQPNEHPRCEREKYLLEYKNVNVQYKELLEQIFLYGEDKGDRTGTGTISLFGTQMKIKLKDGLPLLTTKKVFWRGVVHELLWFLRGDTNIKYLIDNDVNIWNDDAYRWYKKMGGEQSKEVFLEIIKSSKNSNNNLPKIGDYRMGDLGPVYGKQWRSFGSSGRDQIKEVIETLKTNPDDRRMIVVAFNPDQMESMALPPCHTMFQLYTRELTYSERFNLLQDKFPEECSERKSATEQQLAMYNIPKRELSLMWSQRSVDTLLGLPFNIASYAILTHLIAQVVNMEVGELVFNGGDTHIYNNHVDGAKEQISRDCFKYKLPRLMLNNDVKNIDEFSFNDINIENYESYPPIKMVLST